MKQLIASFAVILASTIAFAHPGGHSLVCKTAGKSDSKQIVTLDLQRSNAVGWYAPLISATVNGVKYVLDTADEMNAYGETFHDSPLGVITVSVDNNKEKDAKTIGNFSVVAIPSTVKAFDYEGKSVKWSYSAEKQECSDATGKAKFKGIFRGFINSGKKNVPIDTQIMDCELTYDSGMAC